MLKTSLIVFLTAAFLIGIARPLPLVAGDPASEGSVLADSIFVRDSIAFGTVPLVPCQDVVDTVGVLTTGIVLVELSLRRGTVYTLIGATSDTLDQRTRNALSFTIRFCPRQDTICPRDTLVVRYRSLTDPTDSGGVRMVPVTGCWRSNTPFLMAVPDSLDFGNTRPDSCVTRQTTIVNQSGSQILARLSIVGNSGSFVIDDPPSPMIVIDSFVTVTIRYCPQPGDADGASEILRVSLDTLGQSGALVDVPLTGRTDPLFVARGIDFGDIVTGSCRDTTIVIRNYRRSVVTIFGIRIDRSFGLFTLVFGSRSQLLSGDTAHIGLRFCPDTVGLRTALLLLDTSNGVIPMTIPLTGRGVGVAGRLVLSDSIVEFSDVLIGRSSIRTLVVSNKGGTSTTLDSSLVAPSPPFRIVGPTGGIIVPANDSVEITIEYRPVTTGPHAGSWVGMTTGGVLSQLSASLRGRGVVRTLWLDTAEARVGQNAEFGLRIHPPLDALDTLRRLRALVTYDRRSIVPLDAQGSGFPASLVHADDSTIAIEFRAGPSGVITGNLPGTISFVGLTSGRPTSAIRLIADSLIGPVGAVTTRDGLILLEGCDLGRDGTLSKRTRLHDLRIAGRSELVIDYRAPLHASVHLVVVDLAGVEVLRVRLPEGDDADQSVRVGIPDLPSGIYLLDLRAGSDRAGTMIRIP